MLRYGTLNESPTRTCPFFLIKWTSFAGINIFRSNCITSKIVVINFFFINSVFFFVFWTRIYNFSYEQKRDKPMRYYILQWTKKLPEEWMSGGQEPFISHNCSFSNCYVTSNRSFLDDIKKFDVILFEGCQLTIREREIIKKCDYMKLPAKRSPNQKYVYFTGESPQNCPLYNKSYNNFFNWTWSYRFNSDISYKYITIKDKNNNIIGPNKDINWTNIEEMDPTDEKIKRKLQSKTKAVAWFVSNCSPSNKRYKYVYALVKELQKYGLSLDIYGKCGELKCPRSTNYCFHMLERDYYFYLSFENSFCEDYVTEKILHGLKHYTIPIVYGLGNYTSFMPDGIYLNAGKLGIKALAEEMNDIIHDKERYYKMFRWHNHYSYHRPEDSPDTDYFCQFCARINDEHVMRKTTVVKNFHQWWNEGRCKRKIG